MTDDLAAAAAQVAPWADAGCTCVAEDPLGDAARLPQRMREIAGRVACSRATSRPA